MNKKELAKAVTAYKGTFETEGAEAVKEQLIEGGYDEKDIAQVLEALTPIEKKADKAKTGFEEWLCDIKDGQPEKLKLKRAGVQISEEEAETLNVGRREGGNVGNVLLYFKPE